MAAPRVDGTAVFLSAALRAPARQDGKIPFIADGLIMNIVLQPLFIYKLVGTVWAPRTACGTGYGVGILSLGKACSEFSYRAENYWRIFSSFGSTTLNTVAFVNMFLCCLGRRKTHQMMAFTWQLIRPPRNTAGFSEAGDIMTIAGRSRVKPRHAHHHG